MEASLRTSLLLRVLPFALLVAIVSHSAAAADSAAQINAKLKAGGEVAWLIEDSTEKDGDLAVLFTSRLKGTKPAKFPYLVRGELAPGDTDALNAFIEAENKAEDRVVLDNIVVSLKQKRVLGRLNLGNPEDELAYFPGLSHASLEVLWGPEEEGWHFGVLNYGGRWGSSAVFLIETEGESLRQLNIKKVLDARATAFIKNTLKSKKSLDPARYAIPYTEMTVESPDGGYSVGDPIKIGLNFNAEVPKAPDDYPLVEGTMTVLLETTSDAISAKVLTVSRPKK